MEDQKYIPLFDADTLKKLLEALRAMSTNHARIFKKEAIKKKPHCSVLTSIARVLATREVCGCAHLYDNQLFISTNKETQKGIFRKEVGDIIFQLVTNGFREENKLQLYRRCFKDVIKIHSRRYYNILSQIDSFRINVIDKDDWQDISLEKIKTIQTDLKNFVATNTQDEPIAIACLQTLIRLDDLDKICNQLAEASYEKIRILIKTRSLDDRYKSENDLHCELAALERDHQNIPLESLVLKINESIKNKNFTISKFCCYLCYLAFEGLFETLQASHPEIQSSHFHYLGNTGTAFPTYKSPFFKEDDFSKKAAQKLKEKMETIIHQIKNGKFHIETPTVIENSDWVSHVFDYYEQREEHSISSFKL